MTEYSSPQLQEHTCLRGPSCLMLMKNAEVIGTRYADSYSSAVWDFATGTVVADIHREDHGYVRLGENSQSNVRSLSASRTTFFGWLLS